jgi:hypothetical protein
MSHDQEKTGEGRNTLPVNENNQNRPLNGLGAIVDDTAEQGFDNLQATQQGYGSDQYQYGDALPIVAPAAQQPDHIAWPPGFAGGRKVEEWQSLSNHSKTSEAEVKHTDPR